MRPTTPALTACLRCRQQLTSIIPVGHGRCGGWYLADNRTDLPMLPCTCPVCWPYGAAGRPPRPEPAAVLWPVRR